jgi:hypothetical protein
LHSVPRKIARDLELGLTSTIFGGFMKKIGLLLGAFLAFGVSAAKADLVALNFIDTNDCERARNEVALLNSTDIRVEPVCSTPGAYASNNGRAYTYRLYTLVTVPNPVAPGSVLKLNDIDTNDCQWAQHEISLLNSRQYRVNAVCSGPGQYPSNNGRVYRYRLYTTVIVNY